MKPGQLVKVVESHHADVPRDTNAILLNVHPEGGFVVAVSGWFKNAYDGKFYIEQRHVFVDNVQPVCHDIT